MSSQPVLPYSLILRAGIGIPIDDVPKNTAVESHLYSLTDNEGNHITDVEELLAKVESYAAPVIEKFLRQ